MKLISIIKSNARVLSLRSQIPKTLTQEKQQPENKKKFKLCLKHSQWIRIILALLLTVFIYNQSQQTSINYNEIIQNQKMFLVKNIRGVFPPLNGDVSRLKNNLWRVVYYQNYQQNDFQIFKNYTFDFSKDILQIKDEHCNYEVNYKWNNYSYNIQISQKVIVHKSNTELNKLTSSSEETQNQDNNSQNPNTSQTNNNTPQNSRNLLETQQTKKCQADTQLLESLINNFSVWTISGNYLYLLLENVSSSQYDFFLILEKFH